MPNLENLQSNPSSYCIGIANATIPSPHKFAGICLFAEYADSELLAASFKLSDSQEMVARQQGFDGWQAMKTKFSTESLKENLSSSKVTLVGAEPRLFVTDINGSCECFPENGWACDTWVSVHCLVKRAYMSGDELQV